MAASSKREEMLRKKAEDEARRAGTLPAERDSQGRVINPHIPEFMKVAPWYMGSDQTGLDHQRLPESQKYSSDIGAGWYERGKNASVVPSSSSVVTVSKGACTNCGALTHSAKNCLERPRKVGASKLGVRLAPDDAAQPSLNLSYDGKRDNYNGLDADAQMKALQKRRNILDASIAADEKEGSANAKKTSASLPQTSLRVRTDIAKYLRNLDPDSAFYDPKTRSMRANPTPHIPADQLSFAGDNFVRNTGEADELEKVEAFAALRSSQTADASLALQANPTALSLAKREFELRKEKLAAEKRKKIEEQYGVSSTTSRPVDFMAAASSTYSEYAPDGTLIKGAAKVAPSSCYEEDILEGNHTQIWGSYFDLGTMSWGYGCCWQTVRNSFCTGASGREAARAAILRARPVENSSTMNTATAVPPSSLPNEVSTAIAPPPSASAMYGEGSLSATFDKDKLALALKRARANDSGDHSTHSISESSSDWSSSSESDADAKARKKQKHEGSSKRKLKKHKKVKKSKKGKKGTQECDRKQTR